MRGSDEDESERMVVGKAKTKKWLSWRTRCSSTSGLTTRCWWGGSLSPTSTRKSFDWINQVSGRNAQSTFGQWEVRRVPPSNYIFLYLRKRSLEPVKPLLYHFGISELIWVFISIGLQVGMLEKLNFCNFFVLNLLSIKASQ